jgi:Skp family chaperone for outer membrane proteins
VPRARPPPPEPFPLPFSSPLSLGASVRWSLVLLTLALALPGAAPAAEAQLDTTSLLYSFQVEVPDGQTRFDVPLNGQATIPVIFRDLSRDSYTNYIPPGVPVPGASPFPHSVRWEVAKGVEDSGWFVVPPVPFESVAGDVHAVEAYIQLSAAATHKTLPFNITAVVTTPDGNTSRVSVDLLGFSLGASSFAAQVGRSYELEPKEIAEVEVRLINLGLQNRAFDMAVVDNPCGMDVATSNNNLVPGKGEATYGVSIQAPFEKAWYFSELCTLAIAVNPSGQPDVVQVAYVSVQVNGGYIDPVWVFYTLAAILLLLLLLLILARRKARIEEEILGKPQRPWTIPVEALYLKALRQKDERAWYVVRHYLMEDEYRSALLWYKAYKKSTKGNRKKEALVLRQEKGYERWKAAWQRRIARPLEDADRFEARLQRNLDRHAAAEHRKRVRKAEAVTAKMKAAHDKQMERALAKHGKAAAKAAKKGLPAPKRPVLPEPDYPPVPKPRTVRLEDHKLAKKAAKFRAKCVRKQGDLEVKFEKADARRLRKVRRKVQRLARDPDFVREHPLLKSA